MACCGVWLGKNPRELERGAPRIFIPVSLFTSIDIVDWLDQSRLCRISRGIHIVNVLMIIHAYAKSIFYALSINALWSFVVGGVNSETKHPNLSSGHPKLFIEQGGCKTVMRNVIDDVIKSFKI